MTTTSSALIGSITPLVTPFTDDASAVDDAALVRLVEFQLANGSHGVGCTGSTGEPLALTSAEKLHTIETVVRTVAGRVPVLAGTGSHSLAETIDLSMAAEQLGADALLVVAPYYSKPSQAGLIDYYTRVARSVSCPVVLYNIPGRAAVNIEPATQREIRSACPNVIGVKEANFDFHQVSRDISECGSDWAVYSGIEALCYPMLTLGARGYVSATGNVAPAKVARLYDAFASGDRDAALALHYEMLPLNEVLFVETNPGPVKHLMELMGLCHGVVRSPLARVGKESAEKIRAVAENFGLLSELSSL